MISDSRYVPSRIDEPRAGAVEDTCSRCGQAVPITSVETAKKLYQERLQMFEAMRENN